MDIKSTPILQRCTLLYRPIIRYLNNIFSSKLVTLVLVSPTEQKKLIVKFRESACIDMVRQSVALQTGSPKNMIRIYKSGLLLDADRTIKMIGFSNNDILTWTANCRLGGESTKEKVFCIGLFKTGTSSITKALDILGYRSYHKFGGIFSVEWDDYWNVDDSSAFTEHFNIIKSVVQYYDGFGDAPWIYLYKELDQWFPGSKFILTVRDADSLADSEINQCIRYGSKPASKQRYIDRYNRHNHNVRDYFRSRPDDLLVLDVRTGWPELCEFLGRDMPVVHFPHENKRPDNV